METSKSKMKPQPGEKFHWGPGDLDHCIQPVVGLDYKGRNIYVPTYMWVHFILILLCFIGISMAAKYFTCEYEGIEVILKMPQGVCSESFIWPN